MDRELEHYKDLVDKYLRLNRYALCAYSFVSVFLWKDFFQFHFEIIDGQLCIFAENDSGIFLYLPPLGREFNPETVRDCFALMGRRNSGQGVTRIENVDWRQISFFSGDSLCYLKGYEFLYYKKDIIQLKGKSYKSKRSDYNHFIKTHKYLFAPFCETMKDECLNLYDQWQEDRARKHPDDIYRHMLSENRQVHALGMQNARLLDLVGRVVIVDGEIKAYTFGYWVQDAVFCVLFEVADCTCKGLPVFVFHELCADEELGRARFINTMDDFAMPQLERTKESFRPIMKLPSYTVSPAS